MESTTDTSPISNLGQQRFDKADSVQKKFISQGDSLHQQYDNKLSELDSTQNRLLHDNIVYRSSQKIDSIQSFFFQRSDSLRNTYQTKLSRLDLSERLLRRKLDSLTSLRLPPNNISNKLDSLNKLRANTVTEFETKIQTLKDQATTKLKALDLPPEAQDKLNSVTKNIDGLNIPSTELNIPSLNVPTDPLESITNAGKLNGISKVAVDNSLPSGSIAEKLNVPDGVGEMKKLTNETGKMAAVSGVTDQVKEYSNEAQQVAKGNLDEAKKVSKLAEEKAVQASGIREMESQTKGLEEYKSMTTKAQDPEALKKEAMAKAKQAAVNHFAGKEEQLKAAMERISKYKQKYSSLNGVAEISNKPPNELRGKPLKERIVPGIALQIQKKGDDLLVDFNPYAAYRFTGRLRAGIGWNQRIGYNTKVYGFNPKARIYGPRTFGEFKLGKGFSPRLEIEIMNTEIPPLQQATYDPGHREWVWGAFAGMKKEYKLFKSVKGTAMVMARLVNPQDKSPYADVLNVRFGFEFPMKKKIKKVE